MDTTDTSALPKLPTDLGAARLGLDPTAGSSVGAMGPSLGGRASRGLARFLIIFSIGIGATFGLAVVWRCSQSDACKLVAAAWLVGATNSTPGTDHSQHGGAARSRYCFI